MLPAKVVCMTLSLQCLTVPKTCRFALVEPCDSRTILMCGAWLDSWPSCSSPLISGKVTLGSRGLPLCVTRQVWQVLRLVRLNRVRSLLRLNSVCDETVMISCWLLLLIGALGGMSIGVCSF